MVMLGNGRSQGQEWDCGNSELTSSPGCQWSVEYCLRKQGLLFLTNTAIMNMWKLTESTVVSPFWTRKRIEEEKGRDVCGSTRHRATLMCIPSELLYSNYWLAFIYFFPPHLLVSDPLSCQPLRLIKLNSRANRTLKTHVLWMLANVLKQQLYTQYYFIFSENTTAPQRKVVTFIKCQVEDTKFQFISRGL